MSKFVIILRNSIILAAAVAASVPAFADTVDAAPTIAVSYADLNLSSTEGQSRLHHRLTAAARNVCEGTLQPGTKIQPAYSACVSKAMSAANTQFAALTTKSQTEVAVR
jgi:UrcA family protein